MKTSPKALRFAVMAIDVVVFGIKDEKLCVLLGTVDRPPHYCNIEAFIGGLIEVTETAEDALQRHLANKTNLKRVYTEQLYTFSELKRDLRSRVISISYFGLVRPDDCLLPLGKDLRWCPIGKIPKLAYDHNDIFRTAISRLRGKLLYTNMAQFLLPKECTLTELQSVYELVLGRELDKRNFRKKILALKMVEETGSMQEGVKNRPAALYRFTSNELVELTPIA